jgi:hypothetical protein
MKIVGEIELSGITRVVINRTCVWEREAKDCGDDILTKYVWRKISGGPGMEKMLSCSSHLKTPSAMMAHVNKLLAMGTTIEETRATRRGTINVEVVQVLAYRCWKSSDTLNIVRKDAP